MSTLRSIVVSFAAMLAAGFLLELLKPAIHRVGVALSRVYGPPRGRALLLGTWTVAIGAAYYGFAARNLPAVARVVLAVFAIPAALLMTFLSVDAYRGPDAEPGQHLSRLTRVFAIAIAVLMTAGGALLVSGGSELRLQGFGMVIFGTVFAIAGIRGKTGSFLGSTFAPRRPSSNGANDERRAIVTAAEAFLAGKVGVIETARAIADLSGEIVPEWTNDPAFLVIGAIASESDGLPVGRVRELWAPEALAERDPIIARIESDDRLELEVACRTLIDRYRSAQPTSGR